MLKKITNIGDCGILCDFGEDVNQEINLEVIKLFVMHLFDIFVV